MVPFDVQIRPVSRADPFRTDFALVGGARPRPARPVEGFAFVRDAPLPCACPDCAPGRRPCQQFGRRTNAASARVLWLAFWRDRPPLRLRTCPIRPVCRRVSPGDTGLAVYGVPVPSALAVGDREACSGRAVLFPRWAEDVEDHGTIGACDEAMFDPAGGAPEVALQDRVLDPVLNADARAFEENPPTAPRGGCEWSPRRWGLRVRSRAWPDRRGRSGSPSLRQGRGEYPRLGCRY